MSRTRYDDAYGVIKLDWQLGEPSAGDLRPVLVEVWSPSIEWGYVATMPRIRVQSRMEMRVRQDGEWLVCGYNGNMSKALPGKVRRHAHMLSRFWYSTITLDGWGA